MHLCTSTFETAGVEYLAGRTRVADDHEVLRAHRDKFAEDPAGPISGARSDGFSRLGTQGFEEIVRQVRERIAEFVRHPAHRARSGIDSRERTRRARTHLLADRRRRQRCQRRGTRKEGTQR